MKNLDYILTYHLNTAGRERRPETIEDVDEDWVVRSIPVSSDLAALIFAIGVHHDRDMFVYRSSEEFDKELKLFMDYFDIYDEETAVKYLSEVDWSDGSILIIKVEGPNGVLYDSGYTKESWMGEFVEDESIYEQMNKIDDDTSLC